MHILWKILLGMSPVVAIMLYFVLQKQADFDKNVAVQSSKFELSTKEFDRDFYVGEATMTSNKKLRDYKFTQAMKKENEIKKIEDKHKKLEAKRKKAEELADKELNDINIDLKNINEKDFDF